MSVEKTAILALSELALPIIRQDIAAADDDGSSATAITGSWNKITSVPFGVGVRLPPAIAGLEVVVIRADRSNTHDLAVHAFDGDAVGDGSVIMLGGQRTSSVWLICISEGVWDIAGEAGAVYLADNAALHAATRVPFESIDRARRMVRRIGIFHPVKLGPRVGNKTVAGFLIDWRHIPVANGTGPLTLGPLVRDA